MYKKEDKEVGEALTKMVDSMIKNNDKDRVAAQVKGSILGILGANFHILPDSEAGEKLRQATDTLLLQAAMLSPGWNSMVERN